VDFTLGDEGRAAARQRHPSETDAKLDQKLGQLQPFIAALLQPGVHGPSSACIVLGRAPLLTPLAPAFSQNMIRNAIEENQIQARRLYEGGGAIPRSPLLPPVVIHRRNQNGLGPNDSAALV
jgi:hypothetical protein